MAWIFRARERAQMNATPPEANTEYSRGSGLFRGSFGRWRKASSGSKPAASSGSGPIPAGILAGGLLGALLLLVAELTTLFEIRAQGANAVAKSVGTGSHHTFAMVPIALLAAFLAFAAWRGRSRPALLAIGVLSVIALLISLLGDLPDAQATGLLAAGAGRYVNAASQPSVGLYLETLGATVLLITCVGGFLLLGAPPGTPRRAAD
jgi:hypothetical protein